MNKAGCGPAVDRARVDGEQQGGKSKGGKFSEHAFHRFLADASACPLREMHGQICPTLCTGSGRENVSRKMLRGGGAAPRARDGEPVPLTPKALGNLLVLYEWAGWLGSEELAHAAWLDTFVEHSNLLVNSHGSVSQGEFDMSREEGLIHEATRKKLGFESFLRVVSCNARG